MARKSGKQTDAGKFMEERIKQERMKLDGRVKYYSEPTYRFEIGSHVTYGWLKDVQVVEILHDGKVYMIEYNDSNIPGGHNCMAVPWMYLRREAGGDTGMIHLPESHLMYMSNSLESLMSLHYSFGVNFNPDYQRGEVWNQNDRDLLIDSIFNGIEIGKFVLVELSNKSHSERGFSYEILDGKQRFLTIMSYYEDRFPYKGMYFSDLGYRDRNKFLDTVVSVAMMQETDRETTLRMFLRLNRGGRIMDPVHLSTVEKELNNLETCRRKAD